MPVVRASGGVRPQCLLLYFLPLLAGQMAENGPRRARESTIVTNNKFRFEVFCKKTLSGCRVARKRRKEANYFPAFAKKNHVVYK